MNANYTFAKSLDNASNVRNSLPADSFNLRREYGPSNFDIKQVFTGFIIYDVPSFTSRMPRLTQGWQLNTLLTAHSGEPIDFLSGTNRSATLNNRDRVDVVGDWATGIPARANAFAGARF